MTGLARRRLLSASVLAALAAAAAAGCTSAEPWPWATPPKPSPDVGVLRDAIAAEQAMISRYTAVLAAFPALAGTVSPLLAQHREHLAQLRARLVVPRGASPSVSAEASAITHPRAPRPAVPGAVSGQPAALGYLAAAERDGAAALVRWLARVPPSLAQLLASIGACEATHAALLHSAVTHAPLLDSAGEPQ